MTNLHYRLLWLVALDLWLFRIDPEYYGGPDQYRNIETQIPALTIGVEGRVDLQG